MSRPDKRPSYYRVVKGHGYWCPTPKMKTLGMKNVRCGPDGEVAWAIAEEWNEQWQRVRKRMNGDFSQKGFVYFLLSNNRVKIGFTTAGVSRLAGITTGMADQVECFLVVAGSRRDEKRLHQRFAAYRQKGEWFVASRPVRMTMMRSAMAGYLVHDKRESAPIEQIEAKS